MKNIISEISQQEKNRILEMHKKATSNQYLMEEEETPAPDVKGGPLTGPLVVQLGEKTVNLGDTVEFTFSNVKNSGNGPITINKIMPSSDSATVDTKVPFTLKPGETFSFTVKVKMTGGGTSTRPDQNGVINYDQSVYVFTDGKKERYQFYCRATLIVS